MWRICVVGLSLIVALVAARCEAAPGPNIVMIVSDDQGWTDYGFMGHKQVRTPRLDQLASESLVFRNAYVPSSLCRPSLISMLSGLYPHQHRITSNDPPLPKDGKGRNAEKDSTFLAQRQQMIANIDRIDTLPKLLQKKDYVSFQTGKWWEGDFRRGGFTDGMSQGGRHGDKGLDIGRETMQPMVDFMDKAQAAGKPFFLWYAPMLPHTPHNPPERFLEHFQSVAPTPQIAKYWAMIEWFDETCGQLLDELDKRGLRDNTLVVFLADNGWIQEPDKNGYAAKSKQSPYNGGLRTPLMFRISGKVTPRMTDELAMSIDIPPTVLPLVNMKPPSEAQGINLFDAQAVAGRKAIFGECFEHNAVDIDRPSTSLKWRWCVQGSMKLILPHAPNVEAPPELYNLSSDPSEERDLASQSPEIVKQLTAAINAWWPATE